MKKILLLTIVVALSMLALASCAWISGEGDCAHEVTMPIGAGKAATCKEEGLTAGKKCADCGTVIEEQKTIAKLEHDIEIIPEVKGTCNVEGFTSGERCKDCGEITKAPTSTGYGHVLGADGKCTLCEGGSQGGNQGGNQGGADDTQDGAMDKIWDTDV